MTNPPTVQPRVTVAQIFRPRSVAVVGASNTPTKFSAGAMRHLLQFGYAGRILPINPKAAEIMGVPAFRRIADAPGPIDVALLAVSPEQVLAVCRECAEAEVGCCVIATTGFAELDQDGMAREAEIKALSNATGMRVLGPNCMGYLSPPQRLALTSSLIFDADRPLVSGNLGLISQSGGIMVSLYDRARTAGIGFTACVSLGNQCDLDFCDFLESMIEDAETKAICIYMEALTDPRRFLSLAERCRERAKPLLLYKAGRTDAGARAAMSHTASLTGSYAVLAAACRERGVLLMDDPDDMIRVADLIVRRGRPAGDGIGLLSTSGGSVTVTADRVYETGLRLAKLEEDTRTAMGEHLLTAYANNPIDLGGSRQNDMPLAVKAGKLSAILAADPNVSAMLVVLNTSRPFAEISRQVGAALLASRKPFVVLFTPGGAADDARQALREIDCPYVDNMDSALRVLSTLIESGKSASASVPAPRRPGGLPQSKELAHLPSGLMTEPEVKALLARYGIPVTEEKLCPTLDDAMQAASKIGYPVALKAVCRGLIHKSDIGAVKLGIADSAGLQKAWRTVMEATAKTFPNAAIDGGLVQQMYAGKVELLIGVRPEPKLGAAIVVGAGGTSVELLNDIQIALAPLDQGRALGMLQRLRIWPLLSGWRDSPPLDVDAIVDAIVRMSWLAEDFGERLQDLEINPLMVRSDGVKAVDARANLA